MNKDIIYHILNKYGPKSIRIFIYNKRNSVLIKPFYKLKKKILRDVAIRVPVIRPSEAGEVIRPVKEKSLETMHFFKVHDLIDSGSIVFISPQLNLMKYKNATIFPSSDFILVEKGVIWPQYYKPKFSKTIAFDHNLVKYENDELLIRPPDRCIKVKRGYSLCGVLCQQWTHFLFQYLPKIDFIKELASLENDKLTVILPSYSDQQIIEIMDNYLARIDGLTILKLKDNEAAFCETLYSLENPSYMTDHTYNITPASFIVPQFVIHFLDNKFVHDTILFNPQKKVNSFNNISKIYLQRSGYRTIFNADEIETFFKKKGFYFVEPHKLTLTEKYTLFSQVSEVVGPVSSGFTNLIFSKPGTKALAFANTNIIFDIMFGKAVKHFDLDLHLITGKDYEPDDFNSSYTISLDKIKEACSEIGI